MADEDEEGTAPGAGQKLLARRWFSIIGRRKTGENIDFEVHESVRDAGDRQQASAASHKRRRRRRWRPNPTAVLLIVMLAGLGRATGAATAAARRLLRDTSNYNHDYGEMGVPEVGPDQPPGVQVHDRTTTWSLLGAALFPAGGNDNYDASDHEYAHASSSSSSSVNWANLMLATLLVLLILATAIGNLFVIVAILIERNLRTVGNHLVLSLAFADLLVAVLVMPPAGIYLLLDGWTLGLMLCDLWTSADVFCCTASILHLLAIALDRYWAVTRVDYIRCQRNNRRIAHMISGVWLAALVISIAPVFGWKDDQFERRITHDKECLISQDIGYQIFATCTTFYFPLCLTLIFYWKIYQVARKRIRKKLDNRAKFAPANPSSTSSGSSPAQGGSLASKQQAPASTQPAPRNQSIVECTPKRDGNFKFTTSRLACECACHRAVGRRKAERAGAQTNELREQVNAAAAAAAEQTKKRPPIVNGSALSASCEREQDANNKARRLDAGANQHHATPLACERCTKQGALERIRAVGRDSPIKPRGSRSTSDLRSNSLASCSRTSSLQASSSCQDNHQIVNGHQHTTAAGIQQQQVSKVATAASGCAHSSLSSSNVDGLLLVGADEDEARYLDGNPDAHKPPATPTRRTQLGAQRQLSSATCDCCACTLCCAHQSLTDVNCDDFGCEPPARLAEGEGPDLFPIGEHQGDDLHGPESDSSGSGASSASSSRRSSSLAPDRVQNQQQQQQARMDRERAQSLSAWRSVADEAGKMTPVAVGSARGQLEGARLAPARNMIAICWRRLVQATRTAAKQPDSEALVNTDHLSGTSGLNQRQQQAAELCCPECQCPLASKRADKHDGLDEPTKTIDEEFGRPANRASCLLATAAATTANLALTTTDGLDSRAVADGRGPTTRTRAAVSPVKLHQQHSVNSSSAAASHAAQMEGVESRRERKAAKTLAIITGVFVMCWLPFFVMALAMPLVQIKPPQIVFNFLLWLGYFNSMLNPIIYTIFSPDFRKAFKRLLLGSDDPAAQNRKQRQQRAQRQVRAEQSRQRARFDAQETNGNGGALVVVMQNGQTRHVLSGAGGGGGREKPTGCASYLVDLSDRLAEIHPATSQWACFCCQSKLERERSLRSKLAKSKRVINNNNNNNTADDNHQQVTQIPNSQATAAQDIPAAANQTSPRPRAVVTNNF